MHFLPKVKLADEARDYVMITFGLLLYATGYVCFQLPYHITTGGVAGAAAMIYYATGFPTQYTYFGVNIVLLIVAVKVLGFKFCVKTIYAVFVLTFMLGAFQEFIRLSDGILPQFLGDQSFMACIIAASLQGVGIALVLLNNGSCGGTDIIASIITKYRDITIGQTMMICDIIIISSSWWKFHDWQLILFGYCSLIVTSFMLDYVMDRARQSVQFIIISKKYDRIATAINTTHRGVTVLDGHGHYTGQEQKVLVVLAKKRESTTIFRIINAIDPAAFISQSKVIGVYGEGFDRIRVK